jgi:hypothetical protein
MQDLVRFKSTRVTSITHMPLCAGTRLGLYEILAPIGAGTNPQDMH